MRMLIKKLLKKYGYPPEGQEDAVQVVMEQCELWTDNIMWESNVVDFPGKVTYCTSPGKQTMVAENRDKYNG